MGITTILGVKTIYPHGAISIQSLASVKGLEKPSRKGFSKVLNEFT